MRAELRHIDPNDYPGWDTFAAAEIPEPWDHSGWFMLEIGPEGDVGTEMFQVLVSTGAAVSRAKRGRRDFRVLIVDLFEPEIIAARLREHVAFITANSWDGLVEQLRRTMYWEYEGMGGC
jgi:hypothetical protein